jgi:hypothetical protein
MAMNDQNGGNRAEIQQAIQDAQAAVRDAANAARDAARSAQNAARTAQEAARNGASVVAPEPPPPAMPGASGQAQPIIITQDGENPVTIDMRDGNLVLSQNGNTKVIPWREAVPEGAVQIAWAIPATLSILLIWWPISRAVVGWLRRKAVVARDTGALQSQIAEQFERMERNIDTVAIEVERLSEGQRFTNKLIAERPMAEAVPVSTTHRA